MSQSRQLAVIMFTDIVGYTKLMGEDEQKAFELLKKIVVFSVLSLKSSMEDG